MPQAVAKRRQVTAMPSAFMPASARSVATLDRA